MHLHITVKPNSRQNEIIVNADGTIKVKIKAVPVDGKANEELIAFLSSLLKISKSSIRVEKGQGDSYKKIAIDAEESYVKEKINSIR